MKVGECVVCSAKCWWLITDRELYDKEVCSPECLEELPG